MVSKDNTHHFKRYIKEAQINIDPTSEIDSGEPIGLIFKNSIHGVGIGDKNNKIRPDRSYECLFIYTSEKIIAVVGKRDDDIMFSIPLSHIIKNKTKRGLSKSRIRLDLRREIFVEDDKSDQIHIWVPNDAIDEADNALSNILNDSWFTCDRCSEEVLSYAEEKSGVCGRCIGKEKDKKLNEKLKKLDESRSKSKLNVKAECPYCTGRHNVVVSKEDRDALRLKHDGPPTHVKINCGHCDQTFYLTKGRWRGKFFSGSQEEKTRKTSPGEKVYVEMIN